ncbi:MAG: single-stranded DNA-binding protein [Candidatus Schekmanbacteria bacterium]|nr:single-stranded DNA-binding protein [Candidatus Schekmanbacteria bacterium]
MDLSESDRPALGRIADDLVCELEGLCFGPPVTHVYHPLSYARAPWDAYCERYGVGPREVLLLGMNPGPFGMCQSGVPFGEVNLVRDWLGIQARVGKPPVEHPKRPVTGFACHRSEVSGARLWGWARDRFGTPDRFFRRFFVANYCPLVFMVESGANLTPDKLPSREREPLFAACDRALRRTVEHFDPRFVIGIGKFAAARSSAALGECPGRVVGCVPHPSPASPLANGGWAALMDRALATLGVL